MRLQTSLQQRMEQRQILAPRMIQSMEILQLPMMALQERIDQELSTNPMLELQEVDPNLPDESASDDNLFEDEDGTTLEERELVVQSEGDNAEDFVRAESLARDDEWLDALNEHRPSRAASQEAADRKHQAMQNVPVETDTLRDSLHEQLAFMELNVDVRRVAAAIIDSLNDDGYLRESLADLAAAMGSSIETAEEALACVQSLEPRGVGARSLQECLLLQVEPDHPIGDLLTALIQDHLEDIRQNRLPAIQKRTGIDLETIKDAIEDISHLNPRPGAQFSSERVPYVVPEVIVERTEDGDYEIRLSDESIPRLRINRDYHRMLQNGKRDAELKEFLGRRLQSAKWLMDSIEQRKNTLQRVASAIFHKQQGFLDHGPSAIVPLKMQQIADEVKVHVTTVCRAVDGKYAQTPRGIFPLKHFFGGGTETQNGEAIAYDVIRQKLAEIIEKEDKNKPYSDEELVKQLAQRSITVARRTVTKYRKAMDIPSSRQRRMY